MSEETGPIGWSQKGESGTNLPAVFGLLKECRMGVGGFVKMEGVSTIGQGRRLTASADFTSFDT
jgi:hypothetical protein